MSQLTLCGFLLVMLSVLHLPYPLALAQSDEPFPLHPTDPPPPPSSSTPPSPAPAKARDKKIEKPKAETKGATTSSAVGSIAVPKHITKTIKDAYNSTKEPHLLLILHLPKKGGSGFIELYNRSGKDLALFQFTIEALGQVGEIEFEELPASWSAAKEVKMATLRELEIRKPRAFDADANDIYPRLIIHQTDLTTAIPDLGKQKIKAP